MLVTLLTDFGTADYFVAAMKGVILSHDARIRLVDITHEVPAQDIRTAAFLLASCWRDFPPRTVHLVVVDPGVGSPRRPLAARAGGHFFVGPDNGVFDPVLRGTDDAETRTLFPLRDAATTSATFHGRDVFAPVAAALAAGVAFENIGPPLTDPVPLDSMANRRLPAGDLQGWIVHVDRFGNCVTSFRGDDVAALGGSPAAERTGDETIARILPF
jgi:S-adenosylmethionine hydrolase